MGDFQYYRVRLRAKEGTPTFERWKKVYDSREVKLEAARAWAESLGADCLTTNLDLNGDTIISGICVDNDWSEKGWVKCQKQPYSNLTFRVPSRRTKVGRAFSEKIEEFNSFEKPIEVLVSEGLAEDGLLILDGIWARHNCFELKIPEPQYLLSIAVRNSQEDYEIPEGYEELTERRFNQLIRKHNELVKAKKESVAS